LKIGWQACLPAGRPACPACRQAGRLAGKDLFIYSLFIQFIAFGEKVFCHFKNGISDEKRGGVNLFKNFKALNLSIYYVNVY